MADFEASVRDLIERDCDCTEKALAQMDLRRRINLLISEWRAAGGSDVMPDVRDRVRLSPAKAVSNAMRASGRR